MNDNNQIKSTNYDNSTIDPKKDWTGNKRSTHATLGSSNHSLKDRELNDYYATDPHAGQLLVDNELLENILEPACGEGHLSKVFIDNKISTTSSDLIHRDYGSQKDFFDYTEWHGDIVTNPPYKYAQEFVEHALSIVPDGYKVCMFLKLQFLEGKRRKEFFSKYPPKKVYVSSSRILCAKNGNFNTNESSAVAYAWYVWEKGKYTKPIIEWIN